METTDDRAPEVVLPALVAGTMLADRYRIQARLGAGGGGAVWRCHDEKVDATVALKVINPGADLERWRREVAMARLIAHPNVCRVHDLGEAGDFRFVTMELVEGTCLRDRLSPDLPAEIARELFSQVVAGAAAIHAAGIVHRDLKPDNVVVDRTGRAVIVDFGLARSPDLLAERVTVRARSRAALERPAVTDEGVVVGTPQYMAPEQAAGDVVDARADVWALGLIAHELLTGGLPAKTGGERTVDPAVDAKWPGVSTILRKCVAPLPTERYVDAGALRAALEPKSAVGGKRRWWGLAVAATAVVVGAGTLAMSRFSGHAEAALTATRLTVKQHPHSVAVSPDGTRYAFAIADALWVSELRSGAAGTQWPSPRKLATLWVAGWYGDGSVGVVGLDREGDSHLVRISADGLAHELYSDRQRFVAAVTPAGDRAVVAGNGIKIVDASGVHDHTRPNGAEAIRAVAWAPDGVRFATITSPRDGDDVIKVIGPEHEPRRVWSGPLDRADPLLAWLDERRLAFAQSTDDGTRLLTIDVASGALVEQASWPNEYVGAGSAAGGRLVVVRGTARSVVMASNQSALIWKPLHDGKLVGRDLAGWTDDGRAVFTIVVDGRRRIASAAPGRAPQSWPNTYESDIPDTLVGDDLLVHRVAGDSAELVRVTSDGKRRQLATIAIDRAQTSVVRCAGDRAAPCVVPKLDAGGVAWTDFDPDTGELHDVFWRSIGKPHVRSFALSVDGQRLAVADGQNVVTLVDRDTREVTTTSRHEHAFAAESVSLGDRLWVTGTGFDGHIFGLATTKDRTLSAAGNSRDWLRWYDRPTESRDGKQLAAIVRDFDIDLWQIDGL